MSQHSRTQPKVMVSSTALDLPDHRQGVLDACMRQGMFPLMMEHLPSIDADAIKASTDLVDKADIYLGIFAYRYGYVPKGCDKSVTEMEYNRAVERVIKRLIFLIHPEHPVKGGDVETGEGAAKLEALKKRLGTELVVNFFKSPEGLRADVINSLSQYHQADLTAFHYISDIPDPPEAYIAHPYTLLQRKGLVGRQAELNLLTDWVTHPSEEIHHARILNVVAIGGMGKSALTWKWFNEIAPQEMKPLAGRMWWSFYESDASFENFVTRALAYVTRRPREEVEKIPAPDQESQLLAALDGEPYLIVLDGLERILIAYARMDAPRLLEERAGSGGQTGSGLRHLRKTSDPRAGRFLQKLAQTRRSRILVSSRLFPADLETLDEEPHTGCFKLPLAGLDDGDAIELWRAFGVSGSRNILLPLFITFGKHPLLIQALAAEIKRYRAAPGDITRWLKDNPRFSPSQFPRMQEAMGHVLEFALCGLDGRELKVLHTVAAFRMPANYDTLAALLVGVGKPFLNVTTLDSALAQLEDRVLLGWDRRANRYDLHPLVRGMVWSRLDDDARRSTYGTLEAHFRPLPAADWKSVNKLEDLTAAIELYNTLTGLGRFDDACELFFERLYWPALYRLNLARACAELLEMLPFDAPPKMTPSNRARALTALALAYDLRGRPGSAVKARIRANELYLQLGAATDLTAGMNDLASASYYSGSMRESEDAGRRGVLRARRQLDLPREAVGLLWLGLVSASRGMAENGRVALERALRLHRALGMDDYVAVAHTLLAQRALWERDFDGARIHSDSSLGLAQRLPYLRLPIRGARTLGVALLNLDQSAIAANRLRQVLVDSRAIHLVQEELPSAVALAEMHRRQGDLKAARELLEDVWELAERGPYPLFHADALNVLAQIERDAGNREAAVEAATKAYRLAWCDGPSFAYHWGLEAARAHLKALGAPEPTDLPPYDESKYEPMPEIEINPPDEFGTPAD